MQLSSEIYRQFHKDQAKFAKIAQLNREHEKNSGLHGPNLNLLGTREPSIYGAISLDQINVGLTKEATDAGFILNCYQSNSESDLIQVIHQARNDKIDYIIFNPAGFTHTSIALRDALCAVMIPFIEVHISNIYSREPFRHHSYFSDIAIGTISGLGAHGYSLALTSIIEREPK